MAELIIDVMEDLDDMVEEGGEEKMKKYFQILNTLNEKIGFNTNKKIPGGYEIRIFDVALIGARIRL